MSSYMNNPKKSIEEWMEKKDKYRSEYTFTTPVTINVTCTVTPEQMVNADENSAFFSLDSIIDDFDQVQNYLSNVMSSHHKVDEALKNAYFLDHASIRLNKDCADNIVCVGASFELPYVKHTNTLPYRIVDHNHERYRALDIGDASFTFCGHPQQTVLHPGDHDHKDLVNLDMDFNVDVDFGEHSIIDEDENVCALRGKMMHVLEIVDKKKCYPNGEPRIAKSYVKQNGLKHSVHFQADSYPASWTPDVNEDELRIVGASFDADHYASITHNFFRRFSKIRLCDWENTGIFLNWKYTDKARPCSLTFDMTMVVCFIVKRPDTDAETNITTRLAIHSACKSMEEVPDASNPFGYKK